MLRHAVLFSLALAVSSCTHVQEPNAPAAASAPATASGLGAAAPSASVATGTARTAAQPTSARVQTFPDPAAFSWIPIVSGLESPDDIQFPDDGTDRMFVVEQAGRIRIVESGQLLATPFLDIRDRVGSGGSEQGLLGLAFHPDFTDHPYFYVNYTDLKGNTVIARFGASGDASDPSSEKDLLHVDQPFSNHNGGEMIFGPDGYLYLGLGDGGSQGDPLGNGQNANVLLGKILRINVDHADPYAVPSGNPFTGNTEGGRPEIWAYGLRNPWRFSFDRLAGDLYVADVGQDLWEEVDFAAGNPPALNYGWNYYEGTHPYTGSAPVGLSLTGPVAEYSHQEGGCSIIGGYVYRGKMPEWQGIYLYGDYCSGRIWGLLHAPDGSSGRSWQSKLLFETHGSITSFGEDPGGELYLVDRSGKVDRLQP